MGGILARRDDSCKNNNSPTLGVGEFLGLTLDFYNNL